MNEVNYEYEKLLRLVQERGKAVETRNHRVKRHITLPPVKFDQTPLVTARKTAWKLALREMQWFLSGDAKCPDELKHWWEGQLSARGFHALGYSEQLRKSCTWQKLGGYDQISELIYGLKKHPNSRRLVTTTWNPGDMAYIGRANGNHNVPANCHGSFTQYWVSEGKLIIKTYQRSADMLLGVPHNWIQYWAYGLWLAHRTGLQMGKLIWIFGDAHIYQHESHIQAVREYVTADKLPDVPELIYTPTSEEFLASDFSLSFEMPKPVVTAKPVLL